MDEVKTCSTCSETKECVEFSNSSVSKDRLQARCKACASIHAKEYYEANKEAITTKSAGYYEANKEAIATRKAKYCEVNKEAIATYHAEYREENKEALTSYSATYREENKEAIATTMAKYREVNRDSILAKATAYQKTPKGKLASRNSGHKRRAVVKGGSVTTEELQQLIGNSPNCYYCNCDVTDDNRNIDHYIPLAKGGLHDINNLVIACCTCNQKKNAKMPGVFIASLPEADQERIAGN